MPATARKHSEDYAVATAPAPSERDDWRQAAPLLEHFQENTRAVEEARHERERQVIHRAKRMHRPLRLRFSLAAISGVVTFALLVGVLWLNGLAQSAVRQARTLDTQIEQTRDEIERTQKKIAAQDSAIRIEPLAAQKGWKLAGQSDFDDVTKVGKGD